MGTVTASASAHIAAPPAQVISFLSDLAARPQILTDNYSAVRVEDERMLGFHFAAGGRERDYRLSSSLDGSVLTESDALSSFVNTWQVLPADGGSTVTLSASWTGAGGIGGFFEGLFAPLGLKKIYTQVLANLAGVFAG